MKVLIVGGNGYVGGRLEAHLKSKNFEVSSSARKTHGEVTDELYFERLASQKFDAVIYTVSLNHHECGKDINQTSDVNIKATWRALEAFKNSGTKKFIYFSTQQVYGPFSPASDYFENNTPKPKNAYGLTHLLSENLCNFYFETSDLKAVSVRLSNAVGSPVIPSKHILSLVVPDLCRQAIENQKIKLLSDGTPQRNFISMPDLCRGIETLLKANEIKHSVFNLGSTETLTLGEAALVVAKSFEKLFGKRIEVFRNDDSLVTQNMFEGVKKFHYPCDRLAEVGFTAQDKLEVGVEELLRSLKAPAKTNVSAEPRTLDL